MARLEGSGLLFLRSLCRLTHVGHAQYYKGDGHAFKDYLEKYYPGIATLPTRTLSTNLSLTLNPNHYYNHRPHQYVCGQGGAFEATGLVP